MRYYRKIIRIRAEDSPNVQRARYLMEHYPDISRRDLLKFSEILPGVISWEEYEKRRALWDPIRQCVGLDAEFYEGAEVLMFPPDWLNLAEERARGLQGRKRLAKAIGIDPGEGVANTAMAAVDEWGLLKLVSRKTPDTSEIVGQAIAFMLEMRVAAESVLLDRGGGGQQIADFLRKKGYAVRTVAFGETVTPDPKHGSSRVSERVEQREERYAYKNRRAEMYGDLRNLLDPSIEDMPRFALPAEYAELRRQLAPIPLLYDEEGRMKMLPKNKRTANGKEKTLTELLGCSPDEADATCLAVHGLLHPAKRVVVGAF